MTILNLGCGTKISDNPAVVNIDWSMYLRLRRNPVLRRLTPLLLRGERRERFLALPDNIRVHNLAHGIPFPDNSVAAVYHSHLLEHLDRSVAELFFHEVRRVLKPGGIHRIVVPDFELLCRNYLQHLTACDGDPTAAARHEDFIGKIIEQSVRREANGTSHQPRWRRTVENRLLGDARARGETHQWMYDRVSLAALLCQLGFQNPQIHQYTTSSIPHWQEYGLDQAADGRPHKGHSLYMEAVK